MWITTLVIGWIYYLVQNSHITIKYTKELKKVHSFLNMADCHNFIWPYLHQFFNNSHGLNSCEKPLKIPFDQYQSHLKAISIGQDIRQINW